MSVLPALVSSSCDPLPSRRRSRTAALGLVSLVSLAGTVGAQLGVVRAEQKISETEGGLGSILEFVDEFGSSLAWLGDLDGDGIDELAVGAPRDDQGGPDQGLVWILFMNASGTVRSPRAVGEGAGGFEGQLDISCSFGSSVATLGDLDGDGVVDLAVGAMNDRDGAQFDGKGAVWILFLNSDGTVRHEQKISPLAGGFGGNLQAGDQFGSALASLGDIDGDGLSELAVGARSASTSDTGAVWILSLTPSGTVAREQEISATVGGLVGQLRFQDWFGTSLAALGDLDGDGRSELVVGAPGVGDPLGGPTDGGAIWILWLEADGTVRHEQKIGGASGGFGIAGGEEFGSAVAPLGDFDHDGVPDLAVGAPGWDGNGPVRLGSIWLVALSPDGTLKAHRRISAGSGGFGGALGFDEGFGQALAATDLDGDGILDLASGSPRDDDGDQGAAWILFLDDRPLFVEGTVETYRRIPPTGFPGYTANTLFGDQIVRIGDLDDDGVQELAVSAPNTDPGTFGFLGAVWVLFMEADGSVRTAHEIGSGQGGFAGTLDPLDFFGSHLAAIGDLDGDGNEDLAVGAPGDDDSGSNRGATWILFLNPDGTVRDERKLSLQHFFRAGALASLGDLDGDGIREFAKGVYTGQGDVWILSVAPDGAVLREQEIDGSAYSGSFGGSLASLGDLDGDGSPELAVGELAGRHIWILSLATDGTVIRSREIAWNDDLFGGWVGDFDGLGISLTAVGDLDGDGVTELAAGAPHNQTDGGRQGVVWILYLERDATVSLARRISAYEGEFYADVSRNAAFGSSLAAIGDFDRDGTPDLAVGAPASRVAGEPAGEVWMLSLRGCVNLDFETEDDFTSTLGNGQALAQPDEFGFLVELSSAGANAGLATFDSTPGGPNDPAINADMLIDHGNVLLLQDDAYPAQTVPGSFDVVTDDRHGGDMVFEFTSPASPRSVLLADVNPPPNLGASVTLLDDGGRTRTYAIEPGWTGTYGDAGPHRLDLTTLAPQPGNGTPRLATASEQAGFDPDRVVRLVVHMTGYGAMDELRVCFPNLPPATVATRLGSGMNRTGLSSLTRPVLGSVWNVALDCSGFPAGLAILEVRRAAAAGVFIPAGEVLIAGELLFRSVEPFSGTPSLLAWPIPHAMSLCGVEVHAQGLCDASGLDAGPSKVRGLRARLSNALDLVLGF